MAAMPPWTLPIGLNIHSVGSSEKTARPSATSRMSILSIRPIGGAGNSPAAIACKNASGPAVARGSRECLRVLPCERARPHAVTVTTARQVQPVQQ